MEEDGREKPLRKIAEAFKELDVIVNSEDSELEVSQFAHACSLVSPLFTCLGIAFKFAERDYVAKVNDLAETSKSIPTLKVMIDHDIHANTVRKQGSHTRNLLRVKRGLDMIRVLFQHIITTQGDSLKESASTAYTQVFAPYHGWAIRKAVSAGLYALPSRPQLIHKLNEDEKSAYFHMQSYVGTSNAVINYVDKLFHSKELGIDW